MSQQSPAPSLQLWIALKDVEEYIRDGIARQMNGAESFGGEDMLPLKAVHLLCEKLKPVLSASVYQGGRHAIQVAVDGLNGMLVEMRMASTSPPSQRQALMISACDSARAATLADFQLALAALEPVVGKESAPSVPTVNNITISHNSGIVNLQSVLTGVTQSISNADSLDSAAKETLTALFSAFANHIQAAQPEQPQAAEAAAEQAKDLAAELERANPRPAVLRIKGSGLIEAAKALATVVPVAISTAKQIVEFISAAA